MRQSREILQSIKQITKHQPKRKQDLSQMIMEADNVDIPKIHLNEQLEIIRINPAIKNLVNVRKVDIGRPICHFTTNFYYNNFLDDIKNSLEQWEENNIDITDYEGTLFNLRLLPYLEQGQKFIAIVFITSPQMTHIVERLQANEKTTTALLSAMPDLVVRVSSKGVLLDYLTSESINIKEFGFRDHYIGHLLHNVLPSHIGLRLYNAVMKADFSNETQILEYPILFHKKNKHFKARIIKTELKDVLIIIKDVSEEYTQRKRIKESERRLQSLFSFSPLGMAVISLQFKYLEVNDAMCKMFGYTKEELQGQSIFAISHSSDLLWCIKKVKEELLSDKVDVLKFEKRYIKKNGEEFTVNLSISKFYDPDCHCIRLVTTLEDIDEKKKAEQALKESENLFRSLYENSPEGIIMTNIQGKIQKANQSFCKIFGYSELELQQMYIHELSVKEDKATESKMGKQIMKGVLDNYTMEKMYYRKNGSIIWGNVAISVVRNETGKIEHVIGMVEDITKRKKAEAEIKQINTELESKVEERTKALQASNEELSRFAYVTAHDLKQPLRTVGSFAKLLGKRYKNKLDDDANAYLNFITQGVSNMTELISGLLDYAKQTDENGSQYDVVDFNNLMHKVVLNLGDLIQESNAQIFVGELPTEIPVVTVKIIQVFQNLMANAIKFRKKEEAIKIHIDAKELENHWEFSITDNGIGIKEQYLNTIFQLLKKLHSQEDYTGHGIGLATCKKIVEQHGGDIWVKSVLGKGSTFYFTLLK